MSEEKKDEGWFDILTSIRKIHPLAFLLMFALMYAFTRTLHANLPTPEKIVSLCFSGTLYTIAFLFECARIEKAQKQKEKIWS